MQNNISIPRGGLKKSIDPRNLSNNDLTHAVNTNLEDVDGDYIDLSYEKSNVLSVNFPQGCLVIGRVNRLSKNWTYYFLHNPITKTSLFGYVDNKPTYEDEWLEEETLEDKAQASYKEFKVLIDDSCANPDNRFKFSELHPIQNIVLKEEKTGGVIYFTDFINPSRYIKLDQIEEYYIREVPCGDDQITMCPDIEKMRIHKQYLLPQVSDVKVSSGGSLQRGTYSFLVALSDAMGNEISEYTSITPPLSIWDNSDEQTDKAIRLTLEDLDSDYTHFKVVLIFNQHSDNAQSYRVVGVYPTTNKEIIVTSIGTLQRISYEEISFVNVRVTNSENLTSFNNSLAEYGLVYERELNLQPVVNLMGSYLKWQTHVAREDLYSYPEMTNKYVGYNRNEVVPFSIRFLKRGGSTTALFPLVGREANAIDLQTVSNKDTESLEAGLSCEPSIRDKRWQLYNTATIEDSCGSPQDFVEVTEEFIYTCTDNDTARTGAGSFEIDEPDFEIGTLSGYIDLNGCADVQIICDTLNSDLSYNVVCNGSPCNNNPQLINHSNFITEELNLRVSDIYKFSGKFANFVEEMTDEYYGVTKPLGTILTGTTLTYSVGTFEQRAGNIETVWRSTPYIPTLTNTAQLINYSGYVYPINSIPMTSDPTDTDESRYYNGIEVLYSQPYYHSNTMFHVNRGFVDEAKYLRFHLNKKFDEPIEDEYFNQEDFRIMIRVEDFPGVYDSTDFDNQSAKHNECTIIFDGYVQDYKNKNIIVEPISDKVEDGIRVLVLNSSGAVEATYSSPKTHYSRDIWVYVGTGSLYLPDDDIQLFMSPRYSFQPYFQEIESAGKRVEWDDVIIGTTVTYKDTCTVLEPIVKSCEAVPFMKGGFSYWESSTFYPDNPELFDSTRLKISPADIPTQYRSEFGNKFSSGMDGANYRIKNTFDLTCQPIRHFKFPDNKIAPFMQDTRSSAFSETYIYPLGVTIDEHIVNMFLDIAVTNNLITADERADIYAYEIFRGDLSVNRSVVASGLAYDTREYEERGKTVQYLNYPYNSYGRDILNPDSKQKEGFGQKGDNFGFHSPETDYFTPTIPTELNVQGYQFGYSKGYFDEVEGHPKMVVLSRDAYSMASTLATIEVVTEAAILFADLMSNVDALWINVVGGLGSTGGGSNAVGYGIQIAFSAAVAGLSTFHKYGRYRLQWQETFKNLGQGRNFAHYYYSEGNYNSLRPVQTEGDSIRGIRTGKRIKDSRYVLTDSIDKDKVELNNIDREYSTFLKLGKDFAINYPSEYRNYDLESLTIASSEGFSDESRSSEVQKAIASPYVQLVNYLPSQHGQITDVTWISTGYRGNLDTPHGGCIPVFGGDTFITRHTLKRKIPLFSSTAIGQADLTPFDYKVTNNIGKTPRFYISYDATSSFSKKRGIFPEVISDYSFDNRTQRGFYITPPSKFYLYYYGVPSFLTETRINTNYREWGREPGDNFYPNVGDLGWWTQEKNVSIRTPNYFKYTRTYSNQTNVFNSRNLSTNYKERIQNIVDKAVNGVIFSLPDINENGQTDPWLKFRPLDSYEFETKFGKLKELKGIENEAILARFEHTSILYNKVASTVDDGTSPTGRLGGREIFQRRTTSFVNSELGYGGTKQAESLSCEFGHFYTDTERGQVIQIPPGGGNMIEISTISSHGQPTFMKDWFKRNLPFKILKTKIKGIEELDVDNNYNGIGITMGYDSQHKRVIITKKDYLPLDDCIEYSRERGFFTTCGDDEHYSCPVGYEFNPVTKMCEREYSTPVCGEGYTYNPDTGLCEKPCGNRAALIVDNTSSFSLNTSIEFFKRLLAEISNDTIISFYNVSGTPQEVQVDLTVTEALTFLNSYPTVIDSEVYLDNAVCEATEWLNQDEDVNRVIHLFLVNQLTPQPIETMCSTLSVSMVSQTSHLEVSSASRSTGVSIIGSGDGSTLNNLRNSGFFTDNKVWLDYSIRQEIIDMYPPCDGSSQVDPIPCNCTQEQDMCVCVDIVDPYIDRTTKVFTHDETKFKDVGWTITYNPIEGVFSSFMSYKPNYYTSMQGYFEAGKNNFNAKLWSHGVTNKSYGVFFGKKFPMEAEVVSKASLKNYTGNVEVMTEAKKYYDEQDFFINKDLTFNRSIIYNRRECSGELILDLVKGRLSQYPITEGDKQRIPLTQTEATFNYNYFFDRIDKSKLTPFKVNDENEIHFTLQNINFKQGRPLPRINGDYFLNRLFYDTNSRYKLSMKLHKTLTNNDNL